MQSQFVFESAPFAAAHASTIAETEGGLVAAWFGGPREGHAEVGIWLAREGAGHWSAPVRVASGRDRLGRRQPCWNPVLHQQPGGALLLFYQVGPSPRRWWGMRTASADGGASWLPPVRLPRGIHGPIKNKPVERPDGRLLCPSSTEHLGWRVHLACTTDGGLTWQRTLPLEGGSGLGAIQPTILVWPNRIQLLCRGHHGRIIESWSDDDGRSFGPLAATGLANPDSGIDATNLADGRAVLAHNPSPAGRTPLALSVSTDGRDWRPGPVLEDGPGEFSYPAIIQGRDGRVHVTYTWQRRRIRHVTLDPAEI